MKTIVSLIIVMLGMSLSSFAEKTDKPFNEFSCSVNMDCHSCKDKIERNIAYEKGVKDMDVNLEQKTVTIKYRADKTSADNLKKAIEKLGYKVSNEEDKPVK